jgi:hypothetical protein
MMGASDTLTILRKRWVRGCRTEKETNGQINSRLIG